jgi:glucokinase
MVEKGLGTIGIDLGGTKILFALFDQKFKVVEDFKEKTNPDKDEKRFTEVLSSGLKTLLERAKKEDLNVTAVGAGCAGFIDEDKGVIESSPNIPFIKNYSMRSKVAKLTDADFALGNDVHMGLLGELKLGAAVNAQHVIGVFLGTGIGGALAINGELYRGATGTAGEIGHFLTDPMGPLAGSDRHGVLDDIVSRNAIAAEAAALATKQWAPYLYKQVGTNVADIKSDELAQAIKHGDDKVEELVRSRARIVGIVLANLVDFLSPEMVVLGGGLVEAMPELFIDEVGKGVRDFTIPAISKKVRVVPAKLGDFAVAAGAAWNALEVARKRVAHTLLATAK